MKKLNLGCGLFKKENFINVDIEIRVKPDIIVNLDHCPYPFKDETFELIEMNHVLEHLQNPFKVMKEIYRILKPGGIVIIRVPHFSRGFTHADHKRGFDITFPLYFSPKFPEGFCGVKFILKKLKLHWNAQPYLKRKILNPTICFILNILGKIINFFANLSPAFCSRIWCYWVGGFEEIEFVFQKPYMDTEEV